MDEHARFGLGLLVKLGPLGKGKAHAIVEKMRRKRLASETYDPDASTDVRNALSGQWNLFQGFG